MMASTTLASRMRMARFGHAGELLPVSSELAFPSSLLIFGGMKHSKVAMASSLYNVTILAQPLRRRA